MLGTELSGSEGGDSLGSEEPLPGPSALEGPGASMKEPVSGGKYLPSEKGKGFFEDAGGLGPTMSHAGCPAPKLSGGGTSKPRSLGDVSGGPLVSPGDSAITGEDADEALSAKTADSPTSSTSTRLVESAGGGPLAVSNDPSTAGGGVDEALCAEAADSPTCSASFAAELEAMRSRLREVSRDGEVARPTLGDERRGTWPMEWGVRELAAGRFLAHLFGRLRARWRGLVRPVPWVWRPAIKTRCCYGQNLATRAEFEQQAARAKEVLDWDRAQAHLLKRLESGRAPMILDLFCCAGGVSEGFRRAGGTSFGVDMQDQPSYTARFGERWFHLGDALDRQTLRGLVRRLKPIGVWASPPCEASSTATFGGG